VTVRHIITVLAIIVIALLVGGCCNIFYPDPDTARVLFADDYQYDNNSTTIIGGWSAGGRNASIVDPGIAFFSWYGPAPDGEWYLFSEGCYFKYVKMLTENGGRSGIYRIGKFTADGNLLTLYEINESWYPDQALSGKKPGYKFQAIGDENLTYELQDNNSLAIHAGAGNGTYYRLFTN
jgi:hypothetical protein